ncbi:MAG: hypothetical protein JWQ48_207 [Conexibacter sp.]|nr:hypothetical protein [Conexibacter sp.]
MAIGGVGRVRNMGTRIWGGVGVLVLAVGAVMGWLLLWPHGTEAHVEHWLHSACDYVHTTTVRPDGRSKAVNSDAAQRFIDRANEVKLVDCDELSGGIGYYRFASTAQRTRAVADWPGMRAHNISCVKNAEVLVDTLLGYDPTVAYCHRLHFQVEKPPKRN